MVGVVSVKGRCSQVCVGRWQQEHNLASAPRTLHLIVGMSERKAVQHAVLCVVIMTWGREGRGGCNGQMPSRHS